MNIHFYLRLFSTLFFPAIMQSMIVLAASSELISPTTAGSTHLTVYSDRALVEQSLDINLAQHKTNLKLEADPDNWDFSTFILTAENNNSSYPAKTLAWRHSLKYTADFMKKLSGKSISITVPESNTVLTGTLIYWNNRAGALRSPEGKVTMFTWKSDYLVTADFSPDEFHHLDHLSPGNETLSAEFDLPEPTDKIQLSYINKGFSLENNYNAIWSPNASQLALSLQSTVKNNSDTRYASNDVILAAGDYENKRQIMYSGISTSYAKNTAAEKTDFRQENMQFITLPATYNFPAKSSTMVNLFSEEGIAGKYHHTYEFNNSRFSKVTEVEHPGAYLMFEASTDLPRGNVQVYTRGRKGELLLTSNTQLRHSAAGAMVKLSMGTAYGIDINRRKLSAVTENKKMTVIWQIALINHNDKDVVIEIKDQTFTLAEVSTPLKSKDGQILVPLKGSESKTIEIVSSYSINPDK